MKTGITSKGNNLNSGFDVRFGRTSWLCVYDSETGSAFFYENENKDLNGGAGTRTAEKAAELGVDQVISGDFGPKAKSMLEKFKIKMIIPGNHNRTVGEIIRELKANSIYAAATQ